MAPAAVLLYVAVWCFISQGIPAVVTDTCPALPDVANAERTGNGTAVGDVVLYQCEPGFTITGAYSLTCLAGVPPSWDDSPPNCAATCPVEEQRAAGSGVILSPGYPEQYGIDQDCVWVIRGCGGPVTLSFRSFQTEDGYDFLNVYDGSLDTAAAEYSGQPDLQNYTSTTSVLYLQFTSDGSVTDSGFWIDYSSACCSDPGAPFNGNRAGDSFSPGDVVVFSCDDGFELIGESNATCREANNSAGYYWSNPAPVCQPVVTDTCPALTDAVNAERTGNGTAVGDVVLYQCEPGFTMAGASSLTCLAGVPPNWDSSPPNCTATCPMEEQRAAGSGVILSPGYPEQYGTDQDCVWVIRGCGGPVTLSFRSFQTEEDYDFLKIYEGSLDTAALESSGDTPSVEYSGQPDSKNYTSTTSVLYLQFTSDGSVTDSGFWIDYSCESVIGCGSDEFQCANGDCIDTRLLCDGKDDCGDGSEESADICTIGMTTRIRHRHRKVARVKRQAGCPVADYTPFNGVCYKSFTEPTTRDNASQTCAADGGILAMPKDDATNTFLSSLADVVWGRWLGLTDTDGDGQWVFEDGQTLTSSGYSNWLAGEPQPDNGNGGCVGFWEGGAFWDEKDCSLNRGFICQLNEEASQDLISVGCYEDVSSRKFPHAPITSSDMTNEKCSNHCAQEGFSYSATEHSNQCFCGTDEDFAGLGDARPLAECSNACSGDGSQIYCEHIRTTVSEKIYQWDIARVGSSPLTFRVTANNDVHIALSSARADLPDMYEIVIGGWSNSESAIRRAPAGTDQTRVSTAGILSPGEPRGFWISWTEDGVIAAGRDGESSPFMQWQDPDPLPVLYFGYSTGQGSTGQFSFQCQLEPVGLWTFGAENGTADITGNGNDAVASAVQLTEGPNSTTGSYEFSGSSRSYVEIPNNGRLDVRYSLTILAHIYPTGNAGPLFNYRTDDWGFHFWQTTASQIFVRAVTRDGTLLDEASADVLQQSSWNYVGATYDYGTGELAVWHGGVKVGSRSVGVTQLSTNYAVRVGYRDGDGRAFTGRIACLQLYDYAMQQGQILAARTKCDGLPALDQGLPP
ncbi:CUB and sushi domain-containing protein 1 [Branchiostoma belcheri]|nr:CUB and sushi domain-containing protein 1 [Branchiostoma belcheri]